jgi:hypothetical protein
MSQEFNVDQALSNIETTGSAEGVQSPPASTTGVEPTAPMSEPELIEYTTEGGKTVKETLDMLKKRAAMGYNYAQQMERIKQREAALNGQAQQFESLKRWQEYNDFAEKNPEWAKHVETSWEQRERVLQSQGADDPNSPLHAELQAVKGQLSEVSNFLGQLKQERQVQQQAAEDTALTSEIKSIREKYQDLDFDLADESGKSLEYRVLEHAAQNGIKSFKTAFHDFYHDHLIKMREDKAKEGVVREQQRQRKAGIIGVSDVPTKGLNQAQSVKNKSYDQLIQEALKEMGA